MLATKESQPAHDGTRVNIEVSRHPVIVRLKWAQLEHVFTAYDIHKKRGRLFQVRHGEADMFCTSKSRYANGWSGQGTSCMLLDRTQVYTKKMLSSTPTNKSRGLAEWWK